MTEKVNYYTELELDKNASSEALEQELKVIIEKWFNILNTSKQEEKTEAEYMVRITEEAIEILGNPDKKEEYDREITTLHEDNLSEYEHIYNKAQEFKDLGKLNETMTLAKQLLEINPNDWRGWEIAGRVYHDDNKKEIALNYYEKAIELEKNIPAYVYCNLGIAQKVLGKYVEAFRNFQCSLDISYNFDRSLEECSKLLQYVDIDSVLPFLEEIKEKRNDSLAYETLANAYVLKAEGLVQEIDGVSCFTSEEQIQEYKKRLKKAASYGEIPDLDKKIAEAESMSEKTLDKQKIPVLIIGLLCMLIYLYELHIFFTPLALVILTALAYKSYRPKYEINRLKVGTASFYDELIDKTYIKDSIAGTIFIWFVLLNILTIPYIGIVVYSILTVYIIFSSIYTGVIDKKFKNKLNSEDNYGMIFNGELESERRRRIRKIEWSRWWEKWGPTVWKVTKIIGILALVAIVGYILFWIVVIAFGLMLLAADGVGSSSGNKSDPVEEARLRNEMFRERERRRWEIDQMRKNSRRR